MPLTDIAERFRVTCLPQVERVAVEWRASHVVSLLDPELEDHRLPVIPGVEHHVVRLRDQENPETTAHFPDVVIALFERIAPHAHSDANRILIHCHAGISRSTAMTYCLIAHRAGPGREAEAFQAFMSLVNKPWPNRRIVEILDQAMGRNGKMLAQLDAMREQHPKRIDAWERFNEKRGMFDLYTRYAR